MNSIQEKMAAFNQQQQERRKQSKRIWRGVFVSVTVYVIVSFFTVWFITR